MFTVLPQTLQKQSCQNHQGLKSPGNCLFTLLPSGKRFRSLIAKTERLRRSFFPKAIRLLNSLYLMFYSFYFMYTSLVLYFSIFALSMERTRLSFHCWLYNLCIVVYVTIKLETCGPVFLPEVLNILFMHAIMDSIKYQQIKNLNLTASVRNLIMGRVWIFHQDNNPKQTSK